MIEAIFKDNGSARIIGLRKWRAKERSVLHGGLLFAPESIEAFQEEAGTRGIAFPEVKEIEVSVERIDVAGK